MKSFLTACVVVSGVCTVLVFAQDKSKSGGMAKNLMAAKKTLMEAETMAGAKKMMTGKDSMIPQMVTKETVHAELMHDKDAKGMLEKNAMMKDSGKKMMSDDDVAMAGEKMATERTAMQSLFQELVARHIAAKKMSMMKPSAPKMTMAGKEMKGMMMDDKAMMETKHEIMASEQSAMMMAREELIHSLMLDQDVMVLVEKEAKMHEDPKMASMMSDEKMMKMGTEMTKDKGKMKTMMKESMVRQMIDSKQKMAKGDGQTSK